MTDRAQVSELELSQDLGFQERSWRVQRLGWTALLLLLIAAAAGLFGGGPLSSATLAGDATTPGLQYMRFTRHRAQTEIALTLPPADPQAATARVWIDSAYLDGVDLQGVVPAPETVEAASDRVVFTFRIAQPGAPTTVRFDMLPERVGMRIGRVGLAGGGALAFRQFVYP